VTANEHAVLLAADSITSVASLWVLAGHGGVKLAAAGAFTAGRQWLGLGRQPNRCWFVSGLWLNRWMAFQHIGKRGGD